MTPRLPRPIWFAIPTALLVVAVVGLWVGVPIYRQRAAIEKVQRLAGSFHSEPIGPEWLRALVGEKGMEPIDTVTHVFLPNSDVTDADVAGLCNLTSLDEFVLDGTGITDAGLEQLGRLRELRSLFLSDTEVTDAGVHHLKKLSNLESLYLDGTRITDQGLKPLQELKNLKELYLRRTAVTDAGIAELKKTFPDVNVER